MKSKPLAAKTNLLRYWKNSLADAARATISITPANSYESKENILSSGRIEGEVSQTIFKREERKLNQEKGVTSEESPNWQTLDKISILISLFKVNPQPEFLQFFGNQSSIYPFWIPAILIRSGELRVPDEYFPLVPREFLSPVGNEQPDYIFSTVDKADEAAARRREPLRNWQAYKIYVEEIFTILTSQKLASYEEAKCFTRYEMTLFVPDEEIGAAAAIIQLYEHILKEKELPPLLDSFITLKNPTRDSAPMGVPDFIDANASHLGQMGNAFPLSLSQRKSLYTFNTTYEASPVFAVNGPPGTGKTTLLQSVVANEIVLAAIRGEDAPLILACSANNQAVTNINESFVNADSNLEGLKGRWLPKFSGYATYLPANDKSDDQLKGLNFVKLKKEIENTFMRVETDSYVNDAKDFFLSKANVCLNKNYLQVSEAISGLQNEIKNIRKVLERGSLFWHDVNRQIAKLKGKFIEQHSTELLEKPEFWETKKAELERLEWQVNNYFDNEPSIRKLFCFFGFTRWVKERELAVKPLFRECSFSVSGLKYKSKIALLEFLQDRIGIIILIAKSLNEWQAWKTENHVISNPPRSEQDIWDIEYSTLKTGKRKGYFFDELDVSHRHRSFQLAIHYWEGRWLEAMTTQLNGPALRNGLSDKKERWKTRAMLTPCFVSTFYMAPKFFSYSKAVGKRDDGQPLWDSPPLNDFIDLLIVDESGQVSPEIGVAIFSLAKRAMIVGDVNQIEPVWTVTSKIDAGNLIKHNVIDEEDDDELLELSDKGFLSSNGSIMKMAQNACTVTDPDNKLKEKGIMLLEHRRCYDEIIAYCNDLAYGGMLKPMKGKSSRDELFAPMLLIHNESNSQLMHKDRSNESEAEAVKMWLINNKTRIEAHFKKRIEDLVGIITPFKGQKRLLLNKLRGSFDTSRMKIGTVHALQGAEREIILFSPVYGPGDVKIMFFDRNNKPNMLNVAVSRAKKSFIVIGNEKIFNTGGQAPSGKLRKYLSTT